MRETSVRKGARTIGMAVYGDITFDSRVRREAATLARAGYRVCLVCLGDDGAPGSLPEEVQVVVRRPTRTAVVPRSANPYRDGAGRRVVQVARRLQWLAGYVANVRAWGGSVRRACGPVDLWHLHDLPALAAVLPGLRDGVPVVYDTHELFLEAGTAARLPAVLRRLMRAYEGRLVAKASAVVTVNDGLAEVLRRRYRPRMLAVVHNCPNRWEPQIPRPTLLRDAAGIAMENPVILYHGSLGEHRGIEQLMEAVLKPGLEQAHLVLLGYGERQGQYRALAAQSRWGGRVHVLDPVAPSELLSWVASADVGAMPIQRSTLNHYLSTPNKLFECLAAGVPVVASDFPAMRRIVTADPAGPLGVLCDAASVDSVAAALQRILELEPSEAAGMRARCTAAARERWNWEHESGALTDLYADLLGGTSAPGAGVSAPRLGYEGRR